MNMMMRVVLALALAVACVHAGLADVCTLANPPTATYDACNTMCCTTGTFPVPVSSGVISGCCNDTTAPSASFSCSISNKPYSMACCSPMAHLSPGVPAQWSTNTLASRQCYDSTKYGCCIFQRLVQSPSDSTLTFPVYDSVVYDPATQTCCTGTGTPVLVYSGDTWPIAGSPGVVNLGDTCGTSITMNNIGAASEAGSPPQRRARCTKNSDCPTDLTCCMRPQQQFGENAYQQFVQNANTGLGECIDTTVLSCCGGTSSLIASTTPITVENGTLGFYTYLAHTSFVSQYQACCVDGSIVNKRVDHCPCQSNTDCSSMGSSSTCCKPNSGGYSLASQLTCASTCSNQGASITGCYGACTRPETYNNLADTCVLCGDNTDFDTTGYMQCCQPTTQNTATVAALAYETTYDSDTQTCCPRGTWNNPANLIVPALTKTGRNNPTTYNAASRCACVSNSDCPSSMQCCTQPVYSVYSNSYITTGTCYDPQVEGCCASDITQNNIYTLATDVCCPIGGIIVNSGLSACICNSNSLCPNGGSCCSSSGWYQSGLANAPYVSPVCTPDDTSGCNGYCIDPQFQTCCNNQYNPGRPNTCVSKYQTCCDDGSCVNKHAKERCKKSHLVPTDYGASSSHEFQYTDKTGKKWTSTEAPTVSINFYAWGFPTLLTIISIAILVIGLQMGARGGISGLRAVVMVLSALTSILGILLLWAPTWKYGMFTIITNCAILCSWNEGPWQRRCVIVLGVVLMLYLVDPIATNSILTFHGSFQTSPGGSTYTYSGLQDMTLQMSQGSFSLCTAFYNYFQRDSNLYDTRTFNWARNPTHGICRHDWVFAISVFSGLLIALEFLVVVFGSVLLMGRKN